MTLPANFSTLITTPAKINLGLKVVRRREDGFHDIYTVMEPISLTDTIFCAFRQDSESGFLLQSPQMMEIDGEDNLVLKAARRMLAVAREQGLSSDGRWDFWLEKRVPSGAGLGGGSSNAAGIINLFKNFYKLELSSDELVALAAEIGADVPFFLQPELALAEGIGDRITPLLQIQKRYYLLIKPTLSIATGWAYSALQAASVEVPVNYDIGQFQRELDDGLKYRLENDFETPVMMVYPEIAEIKEWLEQSSDVLGSLMSGSGSVVYAIYPTLEAAVQAEAQARRRWETSGFEFFLARNLGVF